MDPPVTVPAEESSTPPISSDATATVASVQAASSHVADAAATAPTDATHELLTGVKDVLERVEAQLKRGNDLAESAVKPAETTVAATPPAVKPPPVIERYVRRNGRKVKRSG